MIKFTSEDIKEAIEEMRKEQVEKGCCLGCVSWRNTSSGTGECMELKIYTEEEFYCSKYRKLK